MSDKRSFDAPTVEHPSKIAEEDWPTFLSTPFAERMGQLEITFTRDMFEYNNALGYAQLKIPIRIKVTWQEGSLKNSDFFTIGGVTTGSFWVVVITSKTNYIPPTSEMWTDPATFEVVENVPIEQVKI